MSGTPRTASIAIRAIALCFLMAGCAADQKVSDARFLRYFDELTFGTPDAKYRATLTKWSGPFIVSYEGDAAFARMVEEVMTETAGFAGIKISFQENGEAAIHIKQDPAGTSYPVQQDLVRCYVRRHGTSDRITSARIFVARSEPEAMRRCLYHEAFHVLGFGHTGALASIMSPFHNQKVPSRWDILAASLIMRAELEPGDDRAEVLATIASLRSRRRTKIGD